MRIGACPIKQKGWCSAWLHQPLISSLKDGLLIGRFTVAGVDTLRCALSLKIGDIAKLPV